MRRFFNVGALVAALALLMLPSLALAQETTGSISGTVVDPSNKPVSFATVGISSSRGERQVQTDEQGRFLLAFLTPGTYTVTISADGFGTIKDDKIEVGLGQRTSRRYTLHPIMEESVSVEAPQQAPEPVISNLATTTSGSNIPASVAENIPIGRNISNVVFLTPGVKSGGGTGAANPSMGGSSGFENAYIFNGVDVTNGGYGALGAYSNVYGSQGTGINFNFVKETQVLTNGFEAELGASTGGIVNLVTKEGSNEWEGSVYGNYVPVGLQATFRTPQLSLPQAPTLSVAKSDYGFDVGGPISKDHVFFWLGVNPSRTDTARMAPAGFPLESHGAYHLIDEGLNFAGTLSFRITPEHKLNITMFGDPSHTNFSFNRGSRTLRAPNEDLFTKLETGYLNKSINYSGTVTPNFLIDAVIANAHDTFKELLTPGGNAWSGTDITQTQIGAGGNVTLGGIGYTEPNSLSDVDQVTAKFTNIIHDHELKYGFGVENLKYNFVTAYTGPNIHTRGVDGVIGNADDSDTTTGVTYQRRFDCSLLGDPNVSETQFISDPTELLALNCPDTNGDGIRDPANVPIIYRVTRGQLSNPSRETTSKYKYFFVQDTWSTTPNVHVNFGVRYDKQSLTGNTIGYSFPSSLSPRLGVSWDPTHQGKSKVTGFWGRFYEKVPMDMAVRALSQETDIFRAVYYDRNLSVPVAQGSGVGTRYSLGGTGTTTIVGGTKNSYTDKMSIGYERDLGRGWSLNANWQHNKLGRILEDFSNVPASDIALGLNTFGNYIIGNIPPTVPIDTSGGGVSDAHYPSITRDYQALNIEGKHVSDKYFFDAQWTLSNLHGNYEGLFRNDNGQSDPNLTSLFDFPDEALFYSTLQNGDLNTNRTHRIQTFGYYNWGNGFKLGGRFVGQSGTPKLKLASHPVYENTGEISLASRGSLGETPFEYNFDMNFGKKFTLPTNFESSVSLDVDVFNVLGRTYPTNWDWDYDTALNLDTCTVDPADPTCATPQQQLQRLVASVANGVPNPDYGKATSYSAPREIRFSVKWQF